MKHLLSTRLASLAAAVLVGLGGLPVAANASHSDDFTVWDGQGRVAEYVQVTEAQEIANGPNWLYTLTTRVDAAQYGNYTTLYDDPLDPSSVGDIFGITSGANGALVLAFASDVDGLPFVFSAQLSGAHNYFEGSAASFDATMYLAEDLRRDGWTAAFRSDNALNNIPEPGSLALLAMAGLALVSAQRIQAKRR